MREMKDSGVAWIGEIPKEWDILQLSSVVTERKHKNIGMIETNLLSLSYGNVIRKNINTTDGLLPESFEGYNIIEAGDIVLRLTDLQNDHKSLRSGLCTERGIITSAYVTLANRGGTLISEYLHYLLYTFDIYKGFYGMGAGVRQGLNFDGIKKILLTRPKIEEQQTIATYLDQKCTQIDALITNQQKQIEKLKAYKQSLITETVTKGLNPDVPMKDSGVEWIGEIPEDWEIIKYGKICKVKSNLVHPSEYLDYIQVAPDNIEKGSGKLLPCLTVKENGIVSDNHLFFKGQLLYSKIRPILNKVTIAPFDGLCSADIYPIETNQDYRYMMYFMLSNLFLVQVKMFTENRVKMPKINQEELAQITSSIPPIEEQQAIVSYLDQKCTQIDNLISIKQRKIEKLQQYKKSLIYEYVTGKKEVK